MISNHPFTLIINNLIYIYEDKYVILNILLSLKRTCKEFYYYLNENLDKSKLNDPIFSILFRYKETNTIIFNNFPDYNNYMNKKDNKFQNIFIENADSRNFYNYIKLNKIRLNKNSIQIINLFLINCFIDNMFSFTKKIENKILNLYIIKCKFGKKCKLIDKCSYGSLNLILCNNIPRIYIDNQNYLYITKCNFIDKSLGINYLNNIERNIYNNNKYFFYILRCKKIICNCNNFVINNNNIFSISKNSDIESITLKNNTFIEIDKEIDINLIKFNNFKNIMKDINSNYAYHILYDNLVLYINNVILKCNELAINNDQRLQKNIYNYNHKKKQFVINNKNLKNIINIFNYKIKKDLEKYININMVKKLNNLSQDCQYKSEHLTDFQLFYFLYKQKIN